MQRVHNVRGREPNPRKVQHRSCLESNHLGLYHTCSGGPSSFITPVLNISWSCDHHFCSVQETRVRGSCGQRVHLSQNSPQVQTVKLLEILQSSFNSDLATTTGWPIPRTVASSTCVLRTGRSTRRRATNPWPLTSLPGHANLRRRCQNIPDHDYAP